MGDEYKISGFYSLSCELELFVGADKFRLIDKMMLYESTNLFRKQEYFVIGFIETVDNWRWALAIVLLCINNVMYLMK